MKHHFFKSTTRNDRDNHMPISNTTYSVRHHYPHYHATLYCHNDFVLEDEIGIVNCALRQLHSSTQLLETAQKRKRGSQEGFSVLFPLLQDDLIRGTFTCSAVMVDGERT